MDVWIVGSGPQALFMLRMFKSKYGDIGLISMARKVASFSNIPSSIRIVNSASELVEHVKNVLEDGCLVYFAGGFEIQTILEFSPNIFDNERVQPKGLSSLRVFANKRETYGVAKSLEIPILDSLIFDNDFLRNVKFKGPYIVKWNEENTSDNNKDFKTTVLESKEQVFNFIMNFPEENRGKLVVQRYIEVGERGNVSYLGYYENGEHKFGMLGEQVLQYPKGITAYLKEYYGDAQSELIEMSKKLIGGTDISGFCEVEFLIDSIGNSYLIEVNPRPCGWSSALLRKYKNLSSMISEGEKPEVSPFPVVWVNILRYLRGSLSNGTLDFLKGIFKVFRANSYDVFRVRDVRPFISQFIKNR